MKNRILQFRMTAKAVMIAMLFGAVGKMYAYDFSAVCETGQTLYYNIIDATNHYVELTSPTYYGWGYVPPCGDIILPERVLYNSGNYSVTSYTVTSIGDYAFHCYGDHIGTGLTGSLIIPNTVTNIGYMAFSGCTGFTGSLSIPNSVTSIASWAFENCSGFTGTLIIPSSVTSIRGSAFRNCSGLEGIVVDTDNPVFDSRGNCNAIINSSTNELVLGCKNTIIPNDVFSIGPYAFAGCNGLTGNLIIPNSVTMIGDAAFRDCVGLTNNLSLPSSITSISPEAFLGCSGLTSVTIPNSVTTIGSVAFSKCSGLTSIIIPMSVTSIGLEVFSDCSGLEQIIVEDGNMIYDSRDSCNAIIETSNNTIRVGCKNTFIPNTVTSIGNHAFAYCGGLTSVTIPNSVTTIGDWAFENCNDLTSIAFGNSVTRIGDNAFYGCSGLFGSLTIPNSVTIIGSWAFSDCGGLSEVLMLGTNPPSLGSQAFSSFFIYVPYESLNVYKTASNWNNYTNWIFPMAYTTVSGYSGDTGNWHFIASPNIANTAPTVVDNMIAETPYDLYQFNQSATDGEWQNYKASNFNLTNGQGYLYANAEETNIIFKGTFNENETKEVELAYDANADFAGWNLVGNPFPVSAYADRSYYVMNEEGTTIEPLSVSMETAIPACTGVLVKADHAGESVTFSKTTSRGQENQGVLQIALNQIVDRVGPSTGSGTLVDKAIVSFNAGDKLEKFVFNKDNAQLFIPRGKDNYAIISAENTGEVPLNFEAKKNGTYTITVDSELADVDYLHLIDNLTGEDVDLLSEPSYTFEARTTDYASRFLLRFIPKDGPSTGSGTENFAFNFNGTWIIANEGEATLQVVDVLGHVLSSEQFSGSWEKKLNAAPGVYLLRLINGDNIKVQKIIVE